MPQKKEDLPDWESQQVQKVRDWLNEQLPKGSPVVKDLEKDLSDGVVLITLIEKIKKCTIPGTNKNATTKIQKIANLTVILNFIEEELDVRLPVIGPEDIVDGNIKLIMGTLWALIRYIAPTDSSTKTLHHELSTQASSRTRKISSPLKATPSPKKEEPKRAPARVVVAAQAKKLQESNSQETKTVTVNKVVKPDPKSNNNNQLPPPSKDAAESDTETESEEEMEAHHEPAPVVLKEPESKPAEEPKQEEPVIERSEQVTPAVEPVPQPEEPEPAQEEAKHEEPIQPQEPQQEEEPTPAPVEEQIKQEQATPEPVIEDTKAESSSSSEEEIPKQAELPKASPSRRTSIYQETAEIEVAQEPEIMVPPVEEKQEEPIQPEPEQKVDIVIQETQPEIPQSDKQENEIEQKPPSKPVIPVLGLQEEKPRTSSVEARIRHSPSHSPRSPRNERPGSGSIQSPRGERTGSIHSPRGERTGSIHSPREERSGSFQSPRGERSGSMQRKNSVYSPPALPPAEKVEKEIANSPFVTYYEPERNKLCTYRIVLETTNIGRRNDNDVILISKYISRYHARIDSEVRKGETVLVLKDLDSSGGSRVNGARATNKVLEKGDQIKLGKTVMLYSDKLFLNSIVKEGPGYKQSSNLLKSWQARYFVLQGHVIFYFKSKKERQSNQFPNGFIDVDQCIIEQDEKNWFTIKTTKSYSLKFNPPDEKDDWLDAIKGR